MTRWVADDGLWPNTTRENIYAQMTPMTPVELGEGFLIGIAHRHQPNRYIRSAGWGGAICLESCVYV